MSIVSINGPVSFEFTENLALEVTCLRTFHLKPKYACFSVYC